MFGEVQIELGAAKEVVAVPVSSIEYAPYGNSVYVIERSKGQKGDEITSVRQQMVALGNKRGDFVAVTSGLKAGDEVVTLGVFKLRPGAQVVVRTDQSVPATLQPNVKNS
jgi:membrane fusion protein (multidrug efflux system)